MAAVAHGDSEPGRPLQGRTVVVTRAVEQAPALIEPLEALGAEVLAMPVIAIEPPESWDATDDAIDSLDIYEWIVLTSVNGIDAFDERLRLHGLRLSDLADRRVAVIGSATAEHLRSRGLEPALVPPRSRAEGLVDAIKVAGPAGGRVLVARAAEAREVLPDDLRCAGFAVDVVPVYRLATASPSLDVIERFEAGTVDAVLFASGGTARRFCEIVAKAGLDPAELLVAPLVASIGPVTTDVLHGLGVAVDIEAPDTTAVALVDAVARRLEGLSK